MQQLDILDGLGQFAGFLLVSIPHPDLLIG